MKKTLLNLIMLTLAFVSGTQKAGAEETEWQTVWQTDFSSAPTGMTYSVTNGSVNISTGVLDYIQGGGSGNRAINTAFTDNAFNVDTDWKLEFDWGASSANTNSSNVTFSTNSGAAFTITWANYASTATITDATSTTLTPPLTIDGYSKATPKKLSHFTILGSKEGGISLTVTYDGTTVINNAIISKTFGYPTTLNGSLGKAVSRMALDNIAFQTPKVAGVVAAPTYNIIGVNNNARILTLASITEGATFLWSETAPAENETYDSWTAYNGSITTSAATIYAVAKQNAYYSKVTTITTGAGTTLSLTAPTVSVSLIDGVPTYSFASDNSSLIGSPTANLSATLNSTDITLDNGSITPSVKGTMIVTASAIGYADANTTISVAPRFSKIWESADFSTLTDDDANTTLGSNWVKDESTGRWSSWSTANEPYTYYTDGSTSNIKVQNNLQMRGVTSLAIGYGIGRNITGSEAITMLNMNEGYISSYKIYNGYGKTDISSNSFQEYVVSIGTSTSTSSSVNSGRILVQAAMYAPAETISIPYEYSTFCSTSALDFTDNTDVAAYSGQLNAAGTAVTLTQVTQVPAGAGIVLKKLGSATSTTVNVTANANELTDNQLVGITASTSAADLYAANAYILIDQQFCKVGADATGDIPAGKAYISAPAASGAKLNMIFDDNTPTSAIGVEEKTEKADNVIYNLQGLRVQKPAAQGLYIINGKTYRF